MGSVRIPDKVLLFCSVLYKDKDIMEEAVAQLKGYFGEIIFRSESMTFNFTDYYKEEFGSSLKRIIVAFESLVSRNSLPDIKLATNKIEAAFGDNGKRRVNLDPGILSQENICLATTKPYSHRIYLDKGIWADLTLIYKGNAYGALPWTYPDYLSGEMGEILNELRYIYKEKRKCHEA